MPNQHKIRPSRDFTQRTIAQIMAARQQRQFIFDVAWPLVTFSPFILRQLWLWLGYQHDYFALGHWPGGELVLQTYQLMLSGLATYSLLILGVALVAWHFFQTRRLAIFIRTFNQLLRFDWLRT